MVVDKGLDEAVADRIGEYVVLKGKRDLLEKLQKDENLLANESMRKGLEEMELLFSYLESLDALEPVSFDLSLARGLGMHIGCLTFTHELEY